jgi:7-cyano-7-deazaguanine reductase
VIETLPNRYAERPFRVEYEQPEFTSICPLTGAPDFGTLTIRYVPKEKLLELKSLRDYLAAFRARPILQEEIVNEVLDEVVRSVEPRFAEVEGVFNARGAMSTRAVARDGDPKAAA